MRFITPLLDSIVDFISPPTCLHCESPLLQRDALFCTTCGELMTLTPHHERCPRCFSAHYNTRRRKCSQCTKEKPIFKGCASAFEYEGPPATLIKKMKYHRQPFLAKGAGAYMTAQLITLDWPLPDIIVPVPMPRMRLIQRGYNQAKLLAETIGHTIERPVLDILNKPSGEYPQTGQSLRQRKTMPPGIITLKKKNVLNNLTVLLVDDVITTGTTLKQCGKTILDDGPCTLYAMTFCKT
ncbi:MAG: ComF family protein [Waddliaceae bacterium]|jgi:ComF family protein|nr:ComF family protein [Waddliaceae bacterium]MBT3578555.1 ComF family protein [Waddliaceae bacterium]MBT4444700.1 ComF family protein [Waddliaceae bacterium]MBT6928701.1 ComF family protein [Waddliaceae bacterium]MBT7264933.1 ComF family protein [Waddliaceae bacterium]